MATQTATAAPWWRFGHVWLVIAGPALVVLAGFYTLYLALSSPNEIVGQADEARYVRDAGRTVQSSGSAPAMQARNHAQSAVVPVSK
jgi:hypothetical protein